MTATFLYDSDQVRRPVVTELKNLWTYRGLLRLLVSRDLTGRYKRSTLGVWWTVLNPLLTTAVLWIVFSNFFRFEIPGVPFVVYLLTGVLLITFFAQGVIATGSAIVNSSSILSKVYVPAEVFAVAASIAAAVNFGISLIPLLVIQLFFTDLGIPWTVLLVPLPALCLLLLVAGLGLLVASAAVYFFDVLDLTAVFTQLIGYLTPTFYPLSIVPDRFLPFVYANPLYSYLTVFRGFMYEGAFAPGWTFAVMIGTAIFFLILGVWVFTRSWKNLVVML